MPAKAAFSLAFVATLLTAALANALPYLLTRRAYQRDGQEVAGFPLSFRKLGGDCGVSACDSYGFHAVHFAVDLGLALAWAALAGYIASRWGRRKPLAEPAWSQRSEQAIFCCGPQRSRYRSD